MEINWIITKLEISDTLLFKDVVKKVHYHVTAEDSGFIIEKSGTISLPVPTSTDPEFTTENHLEFVEGEDLTNIYVSRNDLTQDHIMNWIQTNVSAIEAELQDEMDINIAGGTSKIDPPWNRNI